MHVFACWYPAYHPLSGIVVGKRTFASFLNIFVSWWIRLGWFVRQKKPFNIEVLQNKNRRPYLFVLIFVILIYVSFPNDMLLICLANEKHPPSQLGYGYFNPKTGPKTVKHRLLYHSATCQDRHLQQFSQAKHYLFPKRLNLTTKQKNRRKHRPS